MTLAWTIFLSFLGAIAALFAKRAEDARRIALTVSIVTFGCAVAGSLTLGDPGTLNTILRVPWIPTAGAEFHLAADGIKIGRAHV